MQTRNLIIITMMKMASLYGKIKEADQARLDSHRKTRRRITIISVSSIILVVVVVAAVVGTTTGRGGSSDNGENGGSDPQLTSSIKAVCDVTLYKDTCYSSLGPSANSSYTQPADLFKLSIKLAIDELSKASNYFSKDSEVFKRFVHDQKTLTALENCNQLLGLAIDHLSDSLSTSSEVSLLEAAEDLRTWLSAAGTYQQTCIDDIDDAMELQAAVSDHLKKCTELTSNSLAIVSWISKLANSINIRRLMSTSTNSYNAAVPNWVSRSDRKLLETSDQLKKKANIVVAKDGSGKYKSISAALKAVADKSKKRTIIYVKNGVYNENVIVEKSKWNVVVVGDGMDSSIVSASLNFVDGTGTFQSATFAVFGKGFIARDMGFRNTAGAIKHQAVALMASADQTIFYRCKIDAYQDSLYAHSNRQFYRDCNIYGTVDFIFGNSAVILQNCNILPKRPMLGQQNTITAQGRFDPNQNTGISIHNCTIWAAENLTSVQTFLGRPWKNYSTTVFMRSMMGSLIDSKGWLPWVGDSAPNSIFYAEFQNLGAGSSTKNRVKWKGLQTNVTTKVANKFTVKSFIQGDKWISDAGLPFLSGLQ